MILYLEDLINRTYGGILVKKSILIIAALLLMLTSVAQASGAKGVSEEGSKKIAIDDNLTITKFDDGRVAPVADVSRLSNQQIDKVLREMKVKDEEIKKFPSEFKKLLVSRGGVKVELNQTLKEYYHSLDGKVYLVTDENRAEIDAIIAKDQETNTQKSGEINPVSAPTALTNIRKWRGTVSAMSASVGSKSARWGKNSGAISNMSIPVGSKSDGKWSASSILFYAGKSYNATEFLYDLYSQYNWTSMPNYYWTDTIAHAWDYNISSEAGSSGAHNWQDNYNSSKYYQESMSIKKEIGGTKGDLDLKYSWDQYGALHDRLHIPITYKGHYKQTISKYYHPYFPEIANVIMKYLSITLDGSFTGQSFEWYGGFYVGNS